MYETPDSELPAEPPGELTVLCGSEGQCGMCLGYIQPLVNGDTRPCRHGCHEDGTGNKRDYERALKHALATQI